MGLVQKGRYRWLGDVLRCEFPSKTSFVRNSVGDHTIAFLVNFSHDLRTSANLVFSTSVDKATCRSCCGFQPRSRTRLASSLDFQELEFTTFYYFTTIFLRFSLLICTGKQVAPRNCSWLAGSRQCAQVKTLRVKRPEIHI